METPTTAKAIVLLAQTSTAKSKKESRANTCTKSLRTIFNERKKKTQSKQNELFFILFNKCFAPSTSGCLASIVPFHSRKTLLIFSPPVIVVSSFTSAAQIDFGLNRKKRTSQSEHIEQKLAAFSFILPLCTSTLFSLQSFKIVVVQIDITFANKRKANSNKKTSLYIVRRAKI